MLIKRSLVSLKFITFVLWTKIINFKRKCIKKIFKKIYVYTYIFLKILHDIAIYSNNIKIRAYKQLLNDIRWYP